MLNQSKVPEQSQNSIETQHRMPPERPGKAHTKARRTHRVQQPDPSLLQLKGSMECTLSVLLVAPQQTTHTVLLSVLLSTHVGTHTLVNCVLWRNGRPEHRLLMTQHWYTLRCRRRQADTPQRKTQEDFNNTTPKQWLGQLGMQHGTQAVQYKTVHSACMSQTLELLNRLSQFQSNQVLVIVLSQTQTLKSSRSNQRRHHLLRHS
jgi:hypothetical protein